MKLLQDIDTRPLLLVPVLALLAWPLIGSGSTWLTLTVAGLAMGMIIFIMASGLTLVFGLMDVLNFGHGLFIALGAFVATSVLGAMGDWTGSGEWWRNMVAVVPAMLVGMAVAAAVGLAFERFNPLPFKRDLALLFFYALAVLFQLRSFALVFQSECFGC